MPPSPVMKSLVFTEGQNVEDFSPQTFYFSHRHFPQPQRQN